MAIRAMMPGDRATVLAMMRALWTDFDDDDDDLEAGRVFVCVRDDGSLGGFVSYALRPWAEGCQSEPCPYVEGWWVAPELRGTGVGRQLIEAVEQWAVAAGHTELGSDVELENGGGLAAHVALGFEATLREGFFRKGMGHLVSGRC